MGRRKYRPNIDNGWDVRERTVLNGRHVEPGTELKIKGERGRFRFLREIETPSGKTWIDVWGGPKGAEQWRSFYHSRVRTVHRIRRTDKALLEARKEAAKK